MVALIVVREILVSGLRLAAIERDVLAHADLGRVKTCTGGRRHDRGACGRWGVERRRAWWALFAALVATWVSGLDYARVAPRAPRGESA